MTTAHRPTWKAAVAKASEGGWDAGGSVSALKSALNLPSHTKLKTRQDVHTTTNTINNNKRGNKVAVSRDVTQAEKLRRKAVLNKSLQKIKQVEEQHLNKQQFVALARKSQAASSFDPKEEEESRQKLLMSEADVNDTALREKYDDDDQVDFGDKSKNKEGKGGGWSSEEEDAIIESDLDASDSDLDNSDSESEDEDSEDDEADLLAELAKIRAERAEQKAKEDVEVQKEEQAQMEEAALIGNPLLQASGSTADVNGEGGKMKRRWNDDVVFRNQTKGEPVAKKRFINDTVRNDFHKRFLNKFIK